MTRNYETVQYRIPNNAIQDSERVFREYAKLYPANEGIVYWAGTWKENIATVELVVAPHAISFYGGVTVSQDANFDFVKVLSRRSLVQLAQVHTHPGKFVDHSDGDDHRAAFKVEGLLSLVVANYCWNGMLPISKCGVHRFESGRFVRLPARHIKKHFSVLKELSSYFEDLRK